MKALTAEWVEKADARKTLAACRAVRRAVRQSLKLKD